MSSRQIRIEGSAKYTGVNKPQDFTDLFPRESEESKLTKSLHSGNLFLPLLYQYLGF